MPGACICLGSDRPNLVHADYPRQADVGYRLLYTSAMQFCESASKAVVSGNKRFIVFIKVIKTTMTNDGKQI